MAQQAGNSSLTEKPADESGPHRTILSVDRIARARGLPLIRVEMLPSVPDGYVPPTAEDRRRHLRPLDAEHVAETKEALREIAQKPDKERAADLGDASDEAAHAGTIAQELDACDATIAHLESLLEYARTRRAIVGTDAVLVVEAVSDEVNHRAKRHPAMLEKYRKVVEVKEARSAKISAGIENAKAQRKPPTP